MNTTPSRFDLRAPIRLLNHFLHLEATGGVFLLVCAVAAMAWANSPWAASYTALWKTEISLTVSDFGLTKSLVKWINDGLMAMFFFLVGLEIKREVLVGALASTRRAMLPIAAAIGGMAVPALFYVLLNGGTEAVRGWGVPMATDIAFAVGVLALLGNRIPNSLKAFLLALAIVDDIGAVLVIALFYTDTIAWASLGYAGALLVALMGVNRLGIRHPAAYGLLGIGVWLMVLASGVHATVAGVLVAMTVPARRQIDTAEFLHRGRQALTQFEGSRAEASTLATSGQQAAVQALERATRAVEAPLHRLEETLHPWVAFGVMPLFALANAGVRLEGDVLASLLHPISLGIMLGLVIGKPLGVTLCAWLAVRLKLADLPYAIRWTQIIGAGALAGIGFTMSLFITGLAFEDATRISLAKIGILSASLIAGAIGWGLLRGTPSRR